MSVVWGRLQTCTSGDPGRAGHSAKIRVPRRFVMLTGRKIPLTLAFAVLVVLAFGSGCHGFFVDPVLTSIAVGPANPTIPVSTGTPPTPSTQQFTAVGTFDDGSTSSTPVTWSSSKSTTVASIGSSSGLATAIDVGETTITATSTKNPTIANNTTLTVVPANITSITLSGACGQSVQQGVVFELLAKDQSGNDISGSITTWTFTAHGTGTTETGFTLGTPDAGGQPFTATLNPLPPSFPFLVDVVASLKIGSTTISSTALCQLSFSQ